MTARDKSMILPNLSPLPAVLEEIHKRLENREDSHGVMELALIWIMLNGDGASKAVALAAMAEELDS